MSSTGALAPLRERNFRLYFASRIVNLMGALMAPVALAFAVLQISDSPTALGVVLAAHSIPMVVFLLVGGVLADRFGRTLVIQTSNVVAGLSQLAIATLVITGEAQIWHVVLLTAVNGVAAAAALPALAGVLPQLVPRAQLQPANVLVSMAGGGLAVVGPTVSSLLVVGVGPGWALGVDGVTYLGAAALLSRIRLPRPVRAAGSSALVDLREGWTYFRTTPWLWVVVLAFSMICAVHQGGFFTLGPALAKGSALGERGWGLILSAEALGLLVAGLVLLRVRLERPLFWGMLGTAAYGAPLIALGLTDDLGIALLAALGAGAGIGVFELAWNLAMQENVPPDMLSRAFSYDALGSFAAIPLGQLLAGPLAVAFGLQRVMLVAGLLLTAVALLTLLSRSVRDLPREPQAQGAPVASA